MSENEERIITMEREELKGDAETPLEIYDYTSINPWEQLISDLEIILIKWNISDSPIFTDKSKTKEDLKEQFLFCILLFLL